MDSRMENFEVFLNDCKDKERREICGLGNPRSNILLVGQEFYSPKPKESFDDILEENYDYCKYLIKGDLPYKIYDGHIIYDIYIKERGFRDVNGKYKRNNTWCNYQALINKILNKPSYVKGRLDFEQFAFTTELSSVPKPTSTPKDKVEREQVLSRVSKRLELFSRSQFIQDFPVIILACGWYIKNQGEGKSRQIDNTFGVRFDNKPNSQREPEGWFSDGKMWFTTHYNEEKTKLVIHTWQVSRYSKELWNQMAIIVNEHLKKQGLI